jgi:hypothetical protein
VGGGGGGGGYTQDSFAALAGALGLALQDITNSEWGSFLFTNDRGQFGLSAFVTSNSYDSVIMRLLGAEDMFHGFRIYGEIHTHPYSDENTWGSNVGYGLVSDDIANARRKAELNSTRDGLVYSTYIAARTSVSKTGGLGLLSKIDFNRVDNPSASIPGAAQKLLIRSDPIYLMRVKYGRRRN